MAGMAVWRHASVTSQNCIFDVTAALSMSDYFFGGRVQYKITDRWEYFQLERITQYREQHMHGWCRVHLLLDSQKAWKANCVVGLSKTSEPCRRSPIARPRRHLINKDVSSLKASGYSARKVQRLACNKRGKLTDGRTVSNMACC